MRRFVITAPSDRMDVILRRADGESFLKAGDELAARRAARACTPD